MFNIDANPVELTTVTELTLNAPVNLAQHLLSDNTVYEPTKHLWIFHSFILVKNQSKHYLKLTFQ